MKLFTIAKIIAFALVLSAFAWILYELFFNTKF